MGNWTLTDWLLVGHIVFTSALLFTHPLFKWLVGLRAGSDDEQTEGPVGEDLGEKEDEGEDLQREINELL